MKRVSVTTVKDEAPYLVEWIAYQKLLGFDTVIVASNDSTDGTLEILERLEAAGWCTAVHFNRADHKGSPQLAGLELVSRLPDLSQPALVLVSDVDEFLQVNVGDGTLDALIEASPEFDMMLVRWRVFGSSGQTHFSESLTTGRFLAASPTKYGGKFGFGSEVRLVDPEAVADVPPSDLFDRGLSQRWTRTLKTLFNYVPGDRLNIHLPRIKRENIRKIDGGGRADPSENYSHLAFYGPHTYEGSYGLCQINHYANRSVDEYLQKILRGDGVYEEDPRGLDHWKIAECNEIVDTGMQRWQEPLSKLVSIIVEEAGVADLLADAIASRQARLQAALASDRQLSALRDRMVRMAGARFPNSVLIE